MKKQQLLYSMIFLLIFNVFAGVKIYTLPTQLQFERPMDWGNPGASVIRVYKLAHSKQAAPFGAQGDAFLYHKRNPALFMGIADLLQRAGLLSLPLQQVLGLALWNLGLVAFASWLVILTGTSASFPLAIGVAAINRYSLMYSSSLHMFSYQFLFMNSFLLFLALALRSTGSPFKARGFWLLALLSQTLLCHNYYMFYVSSFLMGLAMLKWAAYPLVSLRGLSLALIPCLSLTSTGLQIAAAKGGLQNALQTLSAAALKRSVDLGTQDTGLGQGQWLNSLGALWRYPSYIDSRVLNFFGLSVLLFALVLYLLLRISKNRPALHSTGAHKIVGLIRDNPVLWVGAGLSWNLLMIQHSFIHWNSVIYGYFLYFVLAYLGYATLIEHWPKTHWQKAARNLPLMTLAALMSVHLVSNLGFVYLKSLIRLLG